jgi:hypothetical protein
MPGPAKTTSAAIEVGEVTAVIFFEGNPNTKTGVESMKEAASVIAAAGGLGSEPLSTEREPVPPKPFTRAPKLDVPPLLEALAVDVAPAPPEPIVTVTVLAKSERTKMASAGFDELPPCAGVVAADFAPPAPPPTTNTAHIVPEDGLVHVPDAVNV